MAVVAAKGGGLVCGCAKEDGQDGSDVGLEGRAQCREEDLVGEEGTLARGRMRLVLDRRVERVQDASLLQRGHLCSGEGVPGEGRERRFGRV